jgi:uncharacterized membrane protein (TIGR02234 family)
MAERDGRRSTFGPVLLAGLVAGTLAAVAATKPWVEGSSGTVDTGTSSYASAVEITAAQESPLAAALSLVVLACWGVVLVTRGRFRRGVSALGALSAVGLLVATVVAAWSLRDQLADALVRASGADAASVSLTGWYGAALAAAGVAVLTTAAAVRFVPGWPEMGSRYDAPAGAAAADASEPEGNLEIWKAIDEGRDPTA